MVWLVSSIPWTHLQLRAMDLVLAFQGISLSLCPTLLCFQSLSTINARNILWKINLFLAVLQNLFLFTKQPHCKMGERNFQENETFSLGFLGSHLQMYRALVFAYSSWFFFFYRPYSRFLYRVVGGIQVFVVISRVLTSKNTAENCCF